jgi:hypothetical protein
MAHRRAHAHARIVGIDAAAARRVPGVRRRDRRGLGDLNQPTPILIPHRP